jgi:hypothetical protein
LPTWTKINGRNYYDHNGELAVASQGGILYDTCLVNGLLYFLAFGVLPADPPRWILAGGAVNRTCAHQLQGVAWRSVEYRKQADVPAASESLALDFSNTFSTSSSATVTFRKAVTDYEIQCVVDVGGNQAGRLQYGDTNCYVQCSVSVFMRPRGAGGLIQPPSVSTTQPTYTAAQQAALLPWVLLPGCEAWITSPYFKNDSPYWNQDLSGSNYITDGQLGFYSQPVGGAVLSPIVWSTSSPVVSTASFASGMPQAIQVGSSITLTHGAYLSLGPGPSRWVPYTPQAGSPVWLKSIGWTGALSKQQLGDYWDFVRASPDYATEQYAAATSPGVVSSSVVTLS